MTDFSDEILMRFADGELDAEMTAKVGQALESDDALVARLAVFIETRVQAHATLTPLLDEPVPFTLAASVQRMIEAKRAGERPEASSVIPFGSRTANRSWRQHWVLPIAASLAVAVGGLAGYLAADRTGREGGLLVAGINSPALRQALASVVSGAQVNLAGSEERFRVIGTFRNDAQDLCREFEVDSPDSSTVISVACHLNGDWQVNFAVVAPGDSSGYAPASSTEALDAYLAAIDAGAPMPAEEELRALDALR